MKTSFLITIALVTAAFLGGGSAVFANVNESHSGSLSVGSSERRIVAQDNGRRRPTLKTRGTRRRYRDNYRGNDERRRSGVGGAYSKAGNRYGRGGVRFGRGAASFGRNLARGRVVRAGGKLGRGAGSLGKNVGIGTAYVGVGTGRAVGRAGKAVGRGTAKAAKATGKAFKRIFTP